MLGGDESLSDYYKVTFRLITDNNWTLTELEDMIPWELEVYMQLQINHNQERQAEIEKSQQENQ